MTARMSSFGRYTLVRRVGTGGMAEIWKAKAQGPAGFEKTLAIKKVLPHLVEDGEFIDMFVEEAKLVAQLVHPNIVQVFDFGQVGKRDYFIAMEYVAGSNLAQVIKRLAERGARFPLEVSLYIVAEACKGLGAAHGKTDEMGTELQIVHRDVSPQNILVSFGGEVKVTDFGIAKVASALSRTAQGHVRGKLAYMSPEQAATKPLDKRSDLFSLGVVLYELITGRRLFHGTSSSEIFAKVTGFRVPTDDEIGKAPYEVRALIKTALQPDPEERFQDAIEMESALTTALGPDGIVQARHALASILQRLFEDERKLEMTSSEVVPVSPDFAETVAASPSGEHVPVSHSRRAVVPQVEPEEAPSQPSGLTLNRASGQYAKPVSIQQGPPPQPTGLPAQATPAPGGNDTAKRAGLFGGFAVALVVAALAGARFLPSMDGAVTAASPAVTSYGTVTPPAVAMPTVTATVVEALPTPDFRTPIPATPRPVSTRAVAQTPAPPRPTPTAVASVAGAGFLTVNARPWVQVYVGNKLVIAETPLRRYKLPAGRHVVRFSNPTAKFSAERVVEITADSERSIFVDVKTGSVTLR